VANLYYEDYGIGRQRVLLSMSSIIILAFILPGLRFYSLWQRRLMETGSRESEVEGKSRVSAEYLTPFGKELKESRSQLACALGIVRFCVDDEPVWFSWPVSGVA
jgi:hypothetical protein